MTSNSGASRERGAVSILMAVMIVGLVGVAAFAIDIGYGLVVKSELQNIADTSTLAGTRELAIVYRDMQTTAGTDSYWGKHYLTSSERAQIESKINTYSQANKAGSVSISIASGDVTYGKYNDSTKEIEPTDPLYTGVMGLKVTARRDANSNSVVDTFLARVLGINSMSITAESGAALSALRKAPQGKLGIPVGISEFWFKAKNSPCGHHDTGSGADNHGIRLYPTGPQTGETITNAQGCAGWHTYTDYPASASKLKNVLDDQKTGSYISPETEANVTSYNFTGGVIATAFTKMMQLFNAMKDTDGTWTTVVPVYEASDCSNPNGAIKIVGFATAWIYEVHSGSEKWIDATVDCNVIDWGEGGNDYDYGTLVGRPGMTQ